VWHVSYTHTVKRTTYRRSLGTKDRHVAERRFSAVVQDLVALAAPEFDYTIGDLLNAYERAADESRRALRGGHGTSTTRSLATLRLHFGEFRRHQINDAAAVSHRKWCVTLPRRRGQATARPASDGTACRDLRILRAAIEWGRRNQWRSLDNIGFKISDAVETPVEDYLTREEFARLLASCVEPHTRLFCLIAIATGARMSAILELRWDKVEWPNKAGGPLEDIEAIIATDFSSEPEVEFTCPTTGEYHTTGGPSFELNKLTNSFRIRLGGGRGNKRRGKGMIAAGNVRLYRELRDEYDRRKTDRIIEFAGRPLKTIDSKRSYARAGLNKRRRQHLLKHTCCSWLVQAGREFSEIAALIGTSAEVIERHYGHLSPALLETVADVLTVD
jgi:integrase